MALDFLEAKTLRFVAFISFFVFLFLSFDLGMKIFLFSFVLYCLIVFFLCAYWANEWHPERKIIIGLLTSLLHAFIFLLGGMIGIALAQIALKIFPFLINYLRGTISP